MTLYWVLGWKAGFGNSVTLFESKVVLYWVSGETWTAEDELSKFRLKENKTGEFKTTLVSLLLGMVELMANPWDCAAEPDELKKADWESFGEADDTGMDIFCWETSFWWAR